MVNQKTGVYNAVVSFCEAHGLHFEDGMSFIPTTDQRKAIVEAVALDMEAGEITLSAEAAAKYDDLTKLKSYCNGLVSNWIRKDTRLNGNTTYEIKNPGSRAGSGDQVIKELRKLKKTLSNQEQIDAVEDEINSRLSLIQTKKQADVKINMELIPEELRSLVNSNS